MMDQETQDAMRANLRLCMPDILDGTEEKNWPMVGRKYAGAWDCGPTYDNTMRVQIMDAIIKVTGLTEDMILGPRRNKPLVAARLVLWRLLWDLCPAMGVKEMASFCGRDRTMVLYHVKQYKRSVAKNPKIEEIEIRVREIIEAKT